MSATGRLIRRLVRDEQGGVDMGTYVLMLTIVGIGIVAGLTTVRDSAVQGFGDIAAALESLDQSYTVTMTFATFDPDVVIVKEFGFEDDTGPGDEEGEPPFGIEICLPAEAEGETQGQGGGEGG